MQVKKKKKVEMFDMHLNKLFKDAIPWGRMPPERHSCGYPLHSPKLMGHCFEPLCTAFTPYALGILSMVLPMSTTKLKPRLNTSTFFPYSHSGSNFGDFSSMSEEGQGWHLGDNNHRQAWRRLTRRTFLFSIMTWGRGLNLSHGGCGPLSFYWTAASM